MKLLLGLVISLLVGGKVDAQPPPEAEGPRTGDSASEPAAEPTVARGRPTEFDFGMNLFQARDYYRAITAFKRHAFYVTDSTARAITSYMIPLSEYAAGRFGDAAAEFDAYSRTAAPGRLREASEFYQGRCWDLLGQHEAAQVVLRRTNFTDPELYERATFAAGWSELMAGEWADAGNSMRRYGELFPDGPNSKLASRIARELSMTPCFEQKRVAWGAMLSIVPGGGQLYAGRPLDALNSSLIIGASTLLAIRGAKENSSTTLTLGSIIAATFYIANLYGGANAVAVHNRHELESALQSFRAELQTTSFDHYVLP